MTVWKRRIDFHVKFILFFIGNIFVSWWSVPEESHLQDLSCSCSSLFIISYPVLYCIAPFCTVMSCTVLSCIVLSCTVMCCPILYCTVLCCPVLYCAVLYYVVLYCTVLCCTILSYSAITPWYAGIYHLSHISSSILMSIISSSSSQYRRTLCRLARIQLRGLDLIEYDRK